MERRVEAEFLDTLPVENPLARGSRRDLARLNAWMGNARWMGSELTRVFPGGGAQRLVDAGAGDGVFALRVAGSLPASWKGTNLLLLDRHPAVSPQTHHGFESIGWHLATRHVDMLRWIESSTDVEWGAMTANLFLHHFSETQLRGLFERLAQRSGVFVAIEPRRSCWAFFTSLLVGCIGCNRVTRHDAPASVRAGFGRRELTALWPPGESWLLTERPVGLFSHLFVARKAASM